MEKRKLMMMKALQKRKNRFKEPMIGIGGEPLTFHEYEPEYVTVKVTIPHGVHHLWMRYDNRTEVMKPVLGYQHPEDHHCAINDHSQYLGHLWQFCDYEAIKKAKLNGSTYMKLHGDEIQAHHDKIKVENEEKLMEQKNDEEERKRIERDHELMEMRQAMSKEIERGIMKAMGAMKLSDPSPYHGHKSVASSKGKKK